MEPPRKRARRDATPLLDLEAAVDKRVEDYSDDEEKDAEFIDDDVHEEDWHKSMDHRALTLHILRGARHGEDEVDSDDDDGSDDEEIDCDDDEDGPMLDFNMVQATLARHGKLVLDGIPLVDAEDLRERLPMEGENLFQIGCVPDLEESAVFSVLNAYRNHNCISRNPGQCPFKLIKSVFCNPSYPGNIFLEVDTLKQAYSIASRVRYLRSRAVVQVAPTDQTSPLLVKKPENLCEQDTWVRFQRPRSLKGRIGLIRDNERILTLPFACKEDYTGEDFKHIPWAAATVEPSLPTPAELSVFAAYLRRHMITEEDDVLDEKILFDTEMLVRACTLRTQDRVKFTKGEYMGLIGTIMELDNEMCTVFIPSQGLTVKTTIHAARRHFSVGDMVISRTGLLGGRPGWVTTVQGFKVTVVDTQSVLESIVTTHDTLDLYEPPTRILRRLPNSGKCRIERNKVFWISFSTKALRHRCPFYVRCIDSIAPHESSTSRDYPTGTVAFHSCVAEGTVLPELGDEVCLEDEEEMGGTGLVTGVSRGGTCAEISVGNLGESLQLPHERERNAGPLDHLIGKWVRLTREEYKGQHGLVKALNANGIARVEVQIHPIRVVSLPVSSLIIDTAFYAPASPEPAPPIAPEATPVPDHPPDPVIHYPELDCSWLARSEYFGIPVKLEPIARALARPYHFAHTEDATVDGKPMVLLYYHDRSTIRSCAISKLRWLPPDDVNQTVIHVFATEKRQQLYWVLRFLDENRCEVRQAPMNPGSPVRTFYVRELAQVNAGRK